MRTFDICERVIIVGYIENMIISQINPSYASNEMVPLNQATSIFIR